LLAHSFFEIAFCNLKDVRTGLIWQVYRRWLEAWEWLVQSSSPAATGVPVPVFSFYEQSTFAGGDGLRLLRAVGPKGRRQAAMPLPHRSFPGDPKEQSSPVAKTTVPSINPKVAGSNPVTATSRVAQPG
jgi:hypothetical protein